MSGIAAAHQLDIIRPSGTFQAVTGLAHRDVAVVSWASSRVVKVRRVPVIVAKEGSCAAEIAIGFG